jgi:hypothetical protein
MRFGAATYAQSVELGIKILKYIIGLNILSSQVLIRGFMNILN